MFAQWESHGNYTVEINDNDECTSTYPGMTTTRPVDAVRLLILELRSQQAKNHAIEFALRWAGKQRSEAMNAEATETLSLMRSLSDELWGDDFLTRTRLIAN